MDGTAGPIERLIEEGDVVYGVWLDKTEPAGTDFEVLKGIGFLEKHRTGVIRTTIVPCGSREQAIRTERCFAVLKAGRSDRAGGGLRSSQFMQGARAKFHRYTLCRLPTYRSPRLTRDGV
jgi:hypothetical protein